MEAQSENPQRTDSQPCLRGSVVYIRAYDIAYDMKRRRITELLGHPAVEYSVGPGRRIPRQWFFYRPDVIRLPIAEKQGPNGPVQIEPVVKVFNIGAVSIQMRIPFEVAAIEDLHSLYDLQIEGRDLDAHFEELAEKLRHELKPFCIRPVDELGKPEGYTLFCLRDVPGPETITGNRAENWLLSNRRQIGGLLAQEPAAALSEQEINESTERYLSYYDSDLAVVDWDSAVLIGDSESLEDAIHVAELANVQLLELGVYDRILDASLDRAYRDLERPGRAIRRHIHRNLREIRVDLARLSDELLNTTKFFGDWHLARIYQALSARFHLSDWYDSIHVKLKTLGELYGLLHQDRVDLLMVLLEATIVLLFIIDVILLFMGPH